MKSPKEYIQQNYNVFNEEFSDSEILDIKDAMEGYANHRLKIQRDNFFNVMETMEKNFIPSKISDRIADLEADLLKIKKFVEEVISKSSKP